MVGLIIVTLIIVCIILFAGSNKKTNGTAVGSLTLEKCFGEPVFSEVFTLKQTVQWIKSREDKVNNGCKVLVMKATEDNLRSLVKIEITDKVNNYLVLAVVDKQKHNIDDSLLVKYISLDDELESKLEKGDGMLVVGG